MTARSLAIGTRSYPLVLPSLRDPRLHVAAVIISVHVLGQVALHFRVSVPQILAAILTCALIEIAITFRQSGAIVWPASAMLTGSGVALILRLVGTPADQPWHTDGWEVFAVIAGLSLLSKYLIRYRGSHVFNPSNIGLVVAFVVLGASRIEPLDFWWAPLNPGMLAAYAVIIGGGVLITRRLRLLEMAVVFWLLLAAGTGVLAASGHCMTANWAFAPVCGADYFRTIVTSPEVLIFLFFMITDPKTVPSGRVGRVVFAALVAVASTLLMAPMGDEFGSKVALLAGLVVVCAARPLIDRFVPQPRSAHDEPSWLARVGPRPVSLRVAGGASLAIGLGAAIWLAGIPARDAHPALSPDVLNRADTTVDPGTLPPITIDQGVLDFDHTLDATGMQAVAITLAQNLELENQALATRDLGLLPLISHGDRLAELQAAVQAAIDGRGYTLRHYEFDSLDASLLVPFGQQTGLSLGLRGQGSVVEEAYAADGSLTSRSTKAFDQVFALRRATGGRWLNVGVLPPD